MTTENIKTPEDILTFMNDNIKFGWIDIDDQIHIDSMKNFRKLYQISSIEETINSGLGTCIEQVALINYLLNKINIPSKMFCTRIYELDYSNYVSNDPYIECFILYYLNGKTYQLESLNWRKTGIYEFDNEEDAIDSINSFYLQKINGIPKATVELKEIEPGLYFEEFNSYINDLEMQLDKND